jgi:hypothetical protein
MCIVHLLTNLFKLPPSPFLGQQPDITVDIVVIIARVPLLFLQNRVNY